MPLASSRFRCLSDFPSLGDEPRREENRLRDFLYHSLVHRNHLRLVPRHHEVIDSCFISVGLFLIGRSLVAAIFEQGRFTYEDSPIVAKALFFYAIGLSGYFVQQIVTRAFYSLQDSRAPCRSALIAVFTNIILNLILIWRLRIEGLALATVPYEGRVGFTFPGVFGAVATAYFAKYGADREHLKNVTIKSHNNAPLNPKAQFPLTIRDMMDAKRASAQ